MVSLQSISYIMCTWKVTRLTTGGGDIGPHGRVLVLGMI